jgi:hypothetical protein
MKNALDGIMTPEEFRAGVLELAEPIDFNQLIRDGVLQKSGAWYKVLDYKRLPKHASNKIRAAELNSDGTVAKVKFSKVTKSFQKLADRVR